VATVGNLLVNLIAKTAAFDRKIGRSTRRVKTLRSTVQTAASALKGLAVAGAAYLSARALTGFIGKSMQAIDATAKLSRELGITIDELRGLRHAAKLSGMEAGEMDNAIKMLTRRLGEASQGTGEAKNALEMLGLSANQLIQVSPAEALKIIADKMAGLQTASERAAAANYLFGRKGMELLPMLRNGSAGIQEMIDGFVKLRGSINDVDAAKVEAANDAITRAKERIGTVRDALAVGLAPYIKAAADKFASLGGDGTAVAKKIIRGIRAVAKGIAFAADVVEAFVIAFKALRLGATYALLGILKGINFVIKGVTKLINLLPGVNVEFGNLDNTIDALRKSISKQKKSIFDQLVGPSYREKVDDFFDDIETRAEKTAKNIAASRKKYEGLKPALPPPPRPPIKPPKVEPEPRPMQKPMFASEFDYQARMMAVGWNRTMLAKMGAKTTDNLLKEVREQKTELIRIRQAVEKQTKPVGAF